MRKFAKTLAVVGVMTPAGVNAIGVGEIKLHSALNQKLLAEIPLLVSPGEDVAQIRVNLAPSAAFVKAGLARPYYLSNLRFKPIRKADGSTVIQVTSSDVIREPFLDFLVEVDWPQGRMLREFTVLLDPPLTFAEATKVVPTPPGVTPDPVRQTRSAAAAMSGGEVEYGPVRRNESLWTIAEKLKPDPSITTEQMVMALFRANPEAFLNANVNALKAGVTLRIPARETLVELSPAEARRDFQQQYKAWIAQRAPEPRPAADQVEPGQAGERLQQAQLKLEAPGGEEPGSEQVEVPVVQGAAQSDPQTRAMVESLREENQALRARLEALEEQMVTLLELRQSQLATLQQAVVEKPVEKTQSLPAADAGSAEQDAHPGGQAEPLGKEAIPVSGSTAHPVEQSTPVAVPKPVQKPASVTASKPPAGTQPRTLSERSAAEGTSQFEILDNPIYLSLGSGSLALLGIAGWMIWRRRQAATEQADSLLVDTDLDTAAEEMPQDAHATLPEKVASVGMGGMEVSESSFLSEFTPSDFDILEGESAAVDPIAEADVYLAYGRYQQAKELIKQALAEDPERPELRLKLLEIFYAKEDPEAYEAYAQELMASGADRDPDFWGKVVDMGRELCPQSPLFAVDEMPGGDQETIRDDNEDLEPDLGLQGVEPEERLDLDWEPGDSAGETKSLQHPPRSVSNPDQNMADANEKTQEDVYHLDFDLGDIDLKEVNIGKADTDMPTGKEDDNTIAFSLDLEAPDDDISELKPSVAPDDLDEDSVDAGESFDLTDMDELDTKLDLARAYVDMEDVDAAKEILDEVFTHGNDKQKEEARAFLDKLGLTS